jgi:DNA polymerase-3 subunit delta'
VDRANTRGQAAAVAALDAIRASGGTHAVLLAGPAGVGKTTLALDLAAALLCTADGDRPCRECRGCRLVTGGNHPDLHRLAPEGPGGQIRIGDRANPDPGTVRRLISELALLPVEGGARVALIEQAHRLNDDAQSALLKTLEEPPAGVTIILCTDDEERLLPTIRSRCARVRLGPVGLRDIEGLLADRGVADAPTAARLGRLSHGRPGVAIAWAAAPEAVVARDSIARRLLDLVAAPRSDRLAAARELMDSAAGLAVAMSGEMPLTARRGRTQPPTPGSEGAGGTQTSDEDGEPATGAAARRAPVAERRRAVATIIELWRDLARDLAVAQLGDAASIRDQALLEDLQAGARTLPSGAATGFLGRLTRAGELLEANVGPELILDGLLLAWPRADAAVAVGSRRVASSRR